MKCDRLFVIVFVLLIHQCTGFSDIAGYHKWQEGNRTPLHCPDKCLDTPNVDPNYCCACNARRCWDIDSEACPVYSVLIEIVNIFGDGKLVAPTAAAYLMLELVSARLTEIPENICSFSDRLVILDLSDNRLTDVFVLRCLHHLDTLILDNNLITELQNTTFTLMSDLRILSFKHNLIKHLNPNVIALENGNILTADFSNNYEVESIDITNAMHAGPFCQMRFKNSKVEEITNLLNYSATYAMHGPGDLIFENTQLNSFLNFASVGITDVELFEKYFAGTIHIDELSMVCDCAIYPMVAFPNEIGKFWPSVADHNFICQSPEHMKGKDLMTAVREGDFDLLTCDISDDPDCPSYKCQCILQPSQDKILVNCTGVGFKSLPERMPVASWGLNKIDLILDQNDIQTIEYRDYFDRLVNLDLRQNAITEIDQRAIQDLMVTTKLNIENQRVSRLPVAFKYKDPNMFSFGRQPVTCDCSNLWVGDWVRFNDGHGKLMCRTSDQSIVPAEKVSEDSLGCREYLDLPKNSIIVPVVSFVIALAFVIGLCYVFQYDIILLKRRFTKPKNNSTTLNDLFVSFNTENDDVRALVCRHLRPELLKANYSVFVPMMDVVPGGDTDPDHEVTKAVSVSKTYLIILCDSYTHTFETNQEFNTIWNTFINDDSKQIIVINFDNLESGSIKDRRLKSLKRSKYCLDFVDRNDKLMTRLLKSIGTPIEKNIIPEQGDDQKGAQLENGAKQNYDKVENMNRDQKTIIRPRPTGVFERLAKPKSNTCSCVHRVCYVHDLHVMYHEKVTKKDSMHTVKKPRPIYVLH